MIVEGRRLARAITMFQMLRQCSSLAVALWVCISYTTKLLALTPSKPTGVELAAELIELFPNKKITLVHAGPHLMHGRGTIPVKASEYAHRYITMH